MESRLAWLVPLCVTKDIEDIFLSIHTKVKATLTASSLLYHIYIGTTSLEKSEGIEVIFRLFMTNDDRKDYADTF